MSYDEAWQRGNDETYLMGATSDEALAPGSRLHHKQVRYENMLFGAYIIKLVIYIESNSQNSNLKSVVDLVFKCQTCLVTKPGSEGLRI